MYINHPRYRIILPLRQSDVHATGGGRACFVFHRHVSIDQEVRRRAFCRAASIFLYSVQIYFFVAMQTPTGRHWSGVLRRRRRGGGGRFY